MESPALSVRAASLCPSPTLAISARANAMKAEGRDILSFGAGEPDFDTPEPIREAAKRALDEGFTRYTPSAGLLSLREAICEKLRRENGLKYNPDRIVASCGAKHSLYNAFQVLLNPGDEVILLAPYWMTYADQVALAGAVPRVIATTMAEGFRPREADLRAAINERTRAIVVNSPCNPTGAVYDRATLKLIAMLALRHGLHIISDEIYERLTYDGKAESIGALGEDVLARTITIGGVSKTYAMTGWRIGFAAAPLPIAKAMAALQDQVTSNPTAFAQKGAEAAFGLPQSVVDGMREEFRVRRGMIVERLEAIPGVRCRMPEGAFYAFADVSARLRPAESDGEMACALLEEAGIAVVPGEVFQGPGHLRFSYATGRDTIERGIARFAQWLEERS